MVAAYMQPRWCKLCQILGARYDIPVRYDDADMSDPDAILAASTQCSIAICGRPPATLC